MQNSIKFFFEFNSLTGTRGTVSANLVLKGYCLTMGTSETVVVAPELSMKEQSNEMIYLPATKPNQAKYCFFYLFLC